MGGYSTVRASDGYGFRITSQGCGVVLRASEYRVYGKPGTIFFTDEHGMCQNWVNPTIELVAIEPPKIDGLPLPTRPSVLTWDGHKYCWLPLCDAVPGDAKCSGA